MKEKIFGDKTLWTVVGGKIRGGGTTQKKPSWGGNQKTFRQEKTRGTAPAKVGTWPAKWFGSVSAV